MANDLDRFIDSTSLPESLRAQIRAVVGAASLRPIEQVDVARELTTHCEDALAAGQSAETIAASFGDEALLARLIARSKKSTRRARQVEERIGKRGDSIVFVVWRDLRYAARRLMQSPGFTVTAILSLALGIGANTAIFSVVNSLLLADVVANEPDELVNIYIETEGFPYNVFSYPDLVDFDERTTDVFSRLSGSSIAATSMETDGGVQTLLAELVTGDYFPLLGLDAAAGRLLGPDDDLAPGAHQVVVLDHGFWLREFNGDPEVVGQTLMLSAAPYAIVGVAPEAYIGGTRGITPSVYVPIQMVQQIEGSSESRLERRQWHSIFAKARLREGITIERAIDDARAVEVEMRELYPEAWKADYSFRIMPTRDVVMYPAFDGALSATAWLLLAVVGMILLIACANLAGFLLARGVDRRKEIAVRLAMGATRGKLIGQLLTESILLGVLGGAAGVGLAIWMLRALSTADIPFPIPLTFEFAVDGRVLAFSALLSAAAGVLFGLAPALNATRDDVVPTLRDETAGAGGGARSRLRSMLVVAQVAVSVVLLVSAGLFLRSLSATYALDPGFGSDPSAILTFSMPASSYSDEEGRVFIDTLRDRIRGLPGVQAVGSIDNLHLNQANTQFYDVVVDGVPPPPGYDYHRVDWAAADAEFFEAARVPILRGRAFDSRDTADAEPVIVVSEAFAHRFFPDGDALGRTVRNDDGDELTIIGVAGDTKVRTLNEPMRPFLYRPISQRYPGGATIVASTSGMPATLAPQMLRTIREMAPDLIVFESTTMDDHLAVVRFPAQITAYLFGVFATLALALATIGLYGLVSYSQAQRVREVGIRMSLGADPRSVVMMLVRSGLRLVMIGAGIGLLAAFAATRVLANLLVGVSSTDPLVFIAVALLLAGVAMLASWVPARRASRIDPVQALRSE